MIFLCHNCGEWFLGESALKECTCLDCLAAGHSSDPFECGACEVQRAIDHYWSVQQHLKEKREREGKEGTRWSSSTPGTATGIGSSASSTPG